MTFGCGSLTEKPMIQSRRWKNPLFISFVILNWGMYCPLLARAQEVTVSPNHSAQSVIQALKQLRQQKLSDADVIQKSIDALDRDRQEIDSLHRTVAVLQQQLREHGIAPVKVTNSVTTGAGSAAEQTEGSVIASPSKSADASSGVATPLELGTFQTPHGQDAPSRPMTTVATTGKIESITLATRDITRPQPSSEAMAKEAGLEHCETGTPLPEAPSGSPLPILATQDAVDAYRQSLTQLGQVNAEPGIPTTDLAGLETKLRSFIGLPMDSTLIQKITREATQYVSANTNNLVNVYVPPQKLQNGNLVIVFAAATLGQIRTEGQKHISSHDLMCRIRLRPGDQVNLKTLTDDLAFLNTSPWRQVSSSFTPGAEPGEADLILQTVDRYPLRVYGSWDNTGTTLTGLNRWRTGVNWGDAFGVIGSRLDYSFTMGNTPRNLMEHTLLYTMPTSYRDTLTLTGDYSSSNIPIEDGLFNVKGRNIQAGAQWTRLLDGPMPAGSQFTTGFEYKHIGNSLLFNDLAVTNAAPNIYQFYTGVQIPWLDQFGSNSLNARITLAPGFDSSDAFNAARPGSESNYRRINLTYDRNFNLPAGFVLHGRINSQWASGPLISSEQLQISGAAAVRGYREDVLTADAGYVINIEALTSPVSVPIPWLSASGQLQGVFFYDYGQGFERGDSIKNIALNDSGNRFTLSSVGFGARFSINQNVSLRTDVGWRLHGPSSLPSYVIHGSLVVAY